MMEEKRKGKKGREEGVWCWGELYNGDEPFDGIRVRSHLD